MDSLLRSTLTTRQAACVLANLLLYLADPAAAPKLARVDEVWRRDLREGQRGVGRGSGGRQQAAAPHRSRRGLRLAAGRPLTGWTRWRSTPTSAADLEDFRRLVQRWQGAVLLPIDQAVLTLAQDLFSEPGDLALAHKLAVSLEQIAQQKPDWRLPEADQRATTIARNERRFLGFSEEDSGFDPDKYKGQVVVATLHKAKGLEWTGST